MKKTSREIKKTKKKQYERRAESKKNPKIKKEFWFGGVKWSVSYKWNLKDSEGKKIDGETCFVDKTVTLDRLLTPDEKWNVFLHELNHIIIWSSVKFANIMTEEIEEVICEIFANGYEELFNMRWKFKDE